MAPIDLSQQKYYSLATRHKLSDFSTLKKDERFSPLVPMNRENAFLTPDDHLRVPSQSGESLHEFRATDNGILYRLIKHDGAPVKGLVGTWKTLSTDKLLKHLVSCEWQPAAATWFKRHGFTVESVRAELNAARKMRSKESGQTRFRRGK